MKSILFIRHAETEMAGTFCGQSDPPINAGGRLQIHKLLSALAAEKIEMVYTSDLLRAAFTSNALAEAFRIPCIARPALREINFGAWEGLTWQKIQDRDEVYARRWTEAYPNLPAPEGESFTEFQTRVIAEVTAILSATDHLQTAVVTHGGVMRIVLQSMCGVAEHEAWALTKPYCSFFKYPYRLTS
jgi:alpha-ribazole phosphatase/probable phosphoglycerate mutase